MATINLYNNINMEDSNSINLFNHNIWYTDGSTLTYYVNLPYYNYGTISRSVVTFFGSDLSVNPNGVPTNGLVTGITYYQTPSIFLPSIASYGLLDITPYSLVDLYNLSSANSGTLDILKLFTSGDDIIHGPNSTLNILCGFDGHDMILSGNQGGALSGGRGNDVLDGSAAIGNGYEATADYSSETGISGIVLDLNTGIASDTYGNSDTLIHISNVVGSQFADEIRGGSSSHSLNGLAGNDMLIGTGGLATARYESSSQLSLTHNGNQGIIAVLTDAGLNGLTGGSVKDNFGDTDSLVSIENIHGSIFSDNITGNSSRNILIGSTGNDVIRGMDGNDDLYGDGFTEFGSVSDADQLFGGEGNDSLFFDGADTIVNGGDGYDIAVRVDFGNSSGFDMVGNGIEELRWREFGADHVATLNGSGIQDSMTNTFSNIGNWSSIIRDYTLNWTLKIENGIYSSGGSWTTILDYDLSQNFLSYTSVYNELFSLWYQLGTYDNGSSWSTIWDTDASTIWSYYSTFYAQDASLLYQIGTNDNGSKWSINWDTNGTQDCQQYSTVYTQDGSLDFQVGTNDDGTKWSINWDPENSNNWQQYTTYYRQDGSLYYQSGIYDDGSNWFILF